MMGVFIVAECGVNWGTMPDVINMIKSSKEAGADAVKFQYFRFQDIKNHPQFEKLHWLALTPVLARQFIDYGKEVGILVFFTPENEDCVDDLEAAGNPLYKIGHNNCRNKKMWEKVAATGKNIIASVGADSYAPRGMIRRLGCKYRTRVLYCNPHYPTENCDVHMPDFGATYDGFSDHTRGITAALCAVSRGATVIEKHVMIKETDCIDKSVSVTFEEFAEMVKQIRRIEEICNAKTVGTQHQ